MNSWHLLLQFTPGTVPTDVTVGWAASLADTGPSSPHLTAGYTGAM